MASIVQTTTTQSHSQTTPMQVFLPFEFLSSFIDQSSFTTDVLWMFYFTSAVLGILLNLPSLKSMIAKHRRLLALVSVIYWFGAVYFIIAHCLVLYLSWFYNTGVLVCDFIFLTLFLLILVQKLFHCYRKWKQSSSLWAWSPLTSYLIYSEEFDKWIPTCHAGFVHLLHVSGSKSTYTLSDDYTNSAILTSKHKSPVKSFYIAGTTLLSYYSLATNGVFRVPSSDHLGETPGVAVFVKTAINKPIPTLTNVTVDSRKFLD